MPPSQKRRHVHFPRMLQKNSWKKFSFSLLHFPPLKSGGSPLSLPPSHMIAIVSDNGCKVATAADATSKREEEGEEEGGGLLFVSRYLRHPFNPSYNQRARASSRRPPAVPLKATHDFSPRDGKRSGCGQKALRAPPSLWMTTGGDREQNSPKGRRRGQASMASLFGKMLFTD